LVENVQVYAERCGVDAGVLDEEAVQVPTALVVEPDSRYWITSRTAVSSPSISR
jgi:hypothetical protein